MTYKISILRRTQKQLAKIPANDYRKVKKAILDLDREALFDLRELHLKKCVKNIV